jgi:iron complex transport system ATP-binding protein
MIDLQNIEIGFKDKLFGIEKISLVKGGLYVLIGANGRGKTTFLKTLVGEIPSIKGDVLINKKGLKEMSRIDRSRSIAFVGSKQQEVDFLKVKDYVALGRIPYTNLLGVKTSDDIEKVDSALEQLGINHLADKFTNELSDGEKQLAAIGKAIAQETDIIILDEPTAFLDYANRVLVLNLLKKIAITLNKVILFSSHDIDSILEHNAKLLIIDKANKTLKAYSSNLITKTEVINLAF